MKPPRTTGKWAPLALSALCLVLASNATVRADPNVYRNTLPGTTLIRTATGAGTGALIDAKNRWVLTNQHVVGDDLEVDVYFPVHDRQGELITQGPFYVSQLSLAERARNWVSGIAPGALRGRVIARDSKRDLALIQLPSLPASARQLTLASKTAAPGETVHAIGNSGIVGGGLWRYARGEVRQRYRLAARWDEGPSSRNFITLETQMPINPGDSGGPVVNAKGKLVGISVAYANSQRLVSFAIDLTEVKAFLRERPPASPLFGNWDGSFVDADHARRSCKARFKPDGTFEITLDGADKKVAQVLKGTYHFASDVLTLQQPSGRMALASTVWSADNNSFTCALGTRFTFIRAQTGRAAAAPRVPTSLVEKAQLLGQWEGPFANKSGRRSARAVFKSDGTFELTLYAADKKPAQVFKGAYLFVNEVLALDHGSGPPEVGATAWAFDNNSFTYCLGLRVTFTRKPTPALAARPAGTPR